MSSFSVTDALQLPPLCVCGSGGKEASTYAQLLRVRRHCLTATYDISGSTFTDTAPGIGYKTGDYITLNDGGLHSAILINSSVGVWSLFAAPAYAEPFCNKLVTSVALSGGGSGATFLISTKSTGCCSCSC